MKKIQKQIKKFFVLKAGETSTVRLVYLLSAVLGSIALGLALLFFADRLTGSRSATAGLSETETKTEVSSRDCAYTRLLDGVCVESAEKVAPRIVGIMVENSLDAQPLSGVARASVVYEAPAEGNIPRFLALFPIDEEVEKVGPVRSARPYYLDWISEYPGAMYMHVGGSPEALASIRKYGLFDLDEFFHGWNFWRSRDRSAPHNTYTSTDLWNQAWQENADSSVTSSFPSWEFGDTNECTENCVSSFLLSFSPAYKVEWRYNASTTQYERYERGVQDRDDDHTAIVADTVIVERVQATILDSVGRQSLTTIGEGEATILRNGKAIIGKWKKENRTARTEWLDEAGNIIPLKPGKIWIEVVTQTGTAEAQSEN